MVTRLNVYSIAPYADPAIASSIVANADIAAMPTDEAARFLGQCAAETAGFTVIAENLYYTTTARLRAVWPSRFMADDDATSYVKNPQRLANFIYADRNGNRDVASGDGWAYRGGGLIMVTGHDNYQLVGYDTNPDAVRNNPVDAVASAVKYWQKRKLGDITTISALTRAINGGLTGLDDRRVYTERARHALSDVPTYSRTLKIGSQDGRVKALQAWLNDHDFNCGATDGIYGSATQAAVRQFQKSAGLSPVDGIAGPATYNAMKGR